MKSIEEVIVHFSGISKITGEDIRMGFLSICNYLGSEEKLITHIGHICENSRRACQEIREELDSFK